MKNMSLKVARFLHNGRIEFRNCPLNNLISLLQSIIFIFALLFPTAIFSAVAELNGYFEGEFYKDQGSLTYPWNMTKPKNRLELKLNYGGFAYLSFAAETNYNNLRFLFNQGHLEYKGEKYELIFFAREDRHWIDSPLLHLVDSERARDESWGAKAEGVRFNFWAVKNFSGVAILSKYNVTESGYLSLFRIGKDFARKFYACVTYINKTEEIYSLLTSYKFQTAYLTLETAKNKSNWAYELELHGLRFKNLWLNINHYTYGKDFRVSLSKKFNPAYDKEFDRKGEYAELTYLFPQKAINLLYKTNFYRRAPAFFYNPYSVWWNYFELYAEYLGGLSSKFSFELTKDNRDYWKHALFEIGGENQTLKVRLQYKIKDIGVNLSRQDDPRSVGQRGLWGIELRVNLPYNFQSYNRLVIGRGIARSWESGFFQLSYRGFSQTEIYLEYGDPSATENDLANDPDVADFIYQKIANRIKLIVKIYF